MNDNTTIAGQKTVADWKQLREKLRGNNISYWEEAYDFLYERLETRYFNPINKITAIRKYQGEGFAIVTILCSLIEFLETTYKGLVYVEDKPNLENFEYSKSKIEFISFFENRPPFSSVFTPQNELALAFYKKVRCGLLHEATTKSNWVIRLDNSNEFYEFRDEEHVIDRRLFEKRIKEYLEHYKTLLLTDVDRQQCFIRKMNHISGLNIDF